jgi:hypothetical protein
LYGIIVCDAWRRFLIGVKEQALAFTEIRWVVRIASRPAHPGWGIIAALDRGGGLPKRGILDCAALDREENREVLFFLGRMTKTRKLKRNWSVCDLKILIWLICKHCQRDAVAVGEVHNHWESWQLISSLIPGTSADSCLFKWLSLKRHKITLHGWSEEEERILV